MRLAAMAVLLGRELVRRNDPHVATKTTLRVLAIDLVIVGVLTTSA